MHGNGGTWRVLYLDENWLEAFEDFESRLVAEAFAAQVNGEVVYFAAEADDDWSL